MHPSLLFLSCILSVPVEASISPALDLPKLLRRSLHSTHRLGKRGQCVFHMSSAVAKGDAVQQRSSSASSSAISSSAVSSIQPIQSASVQLNVTSATFSLSPTTSSPSNTSATGLAKQGAMKQSFEAAGDTFADAWTFFTDLDPTAGLVTFLSEADARASQIYKVQDGKIILAVDNTTTLKSGGLRKSLRLSSKTVNFTQGQLLLMDAEHMPVGCSLWPAFWTWGAYDWPNTGEIDILEGINTRTHNLFSLHTSDGCTMSNQSEGTGQVLTTNCYFPPPLNTGCGQNASSIANGYGKPFNDILGGVYAVLWDDQGMSMWIFTRDQIPNDITQKQPSPSTWPKPIAFFSQKTCDMKKHFMPQQIVWGTTICGQWAGRADAFSELCSGNCADYVADPRNYDEAYWTINYMRIFE